ncbi:MAG: helix-turn-helix domain-containing protein [Spirochaetaceae bacterium]|jgi:transposase|nr:helix-turn-helix domain-containing protein [Spirochaetaceae bacterium]
MPHKKYLVTLTEEEKKILHEIINKGKQSDQKRKRAQALLLTDEGYTDAMIAGRVGMHHRGIEELRHRFVEEGFETVFEGKPREHRPRALTGEDEARLIALVGGPAPEGYPRWTLQLLKDTWATLEHTGTKTVSRETIRRILKKANLMPPAKPRMMYSPES